MREGSFKYIFKVNKRSRSRTHTEVLKILISNLGSKAVKIWKKINAGMVLG